MDAGHEQRKDDGVCCRLAGVDVRDISLHNQRTGENLVGFAGCGLGINPTKTELILFTIKTRIS